MAQAQPSNPTLQDFVNEAKKLGQEQFEAQRALLREDTKSQADAFTRSLFGQNVGTESGIGRERFNEAVQEQAKRLEPISAQIAANLGQQALSQRFAAQENQQNRDFTAQENQLGRDFTAEQNDLERAFRDGLLTKEQNFLVAQQKKDMLFNLAKTGQLQGTAAEQALANFGIDDPESFLTDDELELQRYATSRGLTLEQALEQRELLGQTLLEDIQNHPERYAGLAPDPEELHRRELEIARASKPRSGGGCCFIFLEARYGTGVMDSVVRRYRDEMMTDRNRRGYYKLSEVLVPLMRKSRVIKGLVQLTMTSPLVAYGRYHYNRWLPGAVFKPVKDFWLWLFDYLGQDHEFIRENGEVV